MSAEEASFDSWIKILPAGREFGELAVSYYDKGEFARLLLDLDIRRRTNNAKSLDDVMRYLYTEFFEKGRNYTPADFQKACELMSGASLEDFFARYVRSREDLAPVYNRILASAGLQLEQAELASGPNDDRPVRRKGFLGGRTRRQT